ncbi:NAD(P)-binding Rossmann-fold superfamily protein [Citrus sinensis]|uniref:NAD(P)-binding Rossmann-fold superfamily protein n=1 Tax=Citrus sinensis TaxID=2711 RepID=A0ACB8HTX2_CITSI|nr:NAD(P)-binding Rossmann-fold superfamily protein [Citrus sinensis]
MWLFSRKGPSGFSASSTAEEVTQGIDGTGLTAIVTGASSGIGTETARVLALRGVHVIMAVRNMAAGKDVREAIVKEIPSAKVDAMELDVSSLASVRKFASEYNSQGRPLNILMTGNGNNKHRFSVYIIAKIVFKSFKTEQYCSMEVTTYNGLAVFGSPQKTAQKSSREGRIVNVSSEAHRFAYSEGIRFDKINDESAYNSFGAYGQSKLANILHAKELAKHLKEDGVNITANSLHPGSIVTNLFRYNGILRGFCNTVGKLVLKNIPQGAATTCYVALHPQVQGVSGEYFSDSNIYKPNSQGQNMELAKKLWDFSMNLVK